MRTSFLVVLSLPALVFAADLSVDRDPAGYLILGTRVVRVKNLTIEPPGCHVGVNCPTPVRGVGRCGVLNATNASVPAAGQVVGDRVCLNGPPGSLFAVFRNQPATCGLTCAMVQHQTLRPDCSAPFQAPILGDLDGDGTPSCDDHCISDLGDIARACGVTLPFPAACNPSAPQILVTFDQDCSTGDILLGNHHCDLGAGVYGAIRIDNGGELVLAPGTTTICSLVARLSTKVTSSGPATVLVPGAGVVKFHNDATVGTTCGALRIVTERGAIKFSRHGRYVVDACAIAGKLNLGGDNLLRGHFVGGVSVAMDPDNHGQCCPTTTTTSTTRPTTTSTATTTSTSTSSTSTSSSTAPPTSAPFITSTTTTSSTVTTASTTTAPTTTASTTTASTASSSTTLATVTTTTRVSTTSTTLIGCRLTGGGFVIGEADHDMFKTTFGGQVGAPCGCSGCFTELDRKDAHVQGNWTHSRKHKNGNFKADAFNSLICGCEGEMRGNLCIPGPPPRTPANTICVSGVGGFSEQGSARKGQTVVFRLEVKDFGEPGRDDHYRLRMWPVDDNVDALAAAVCCTQAEGSLPPDPLVDDGGDLIGGNLQIHPELGKSTAGICPPPASSCRP